MYLSIICSPCSCCVPNEFKRQNLFESKTEEWNINFVAACLLLILMSLYCVRIVREWSARNGASTYKHTHTRVKHIVNRWILTVFIAFIWKFLSHTRCRRCCRRRRLHHIFFVSAKTFTRANTYLYTTPKKLADTLQLECETESKENTAYHEE